MFSSHVRFIDRRAFLSGPRAQRGFPSTADHVTLVQILHNTVDRSVEPFSDVMVWCYRQSHSKTFITHINRLNNNKQLITNKQTIACVFIVINWLRENGDWVIVHVTDTYSRRSCVFSDVCPWAAAILVFTLKPGKNTIQPLWSIKEFIRWQKCRS